ncbi:MAG: sulfatase-like hydrolase/transferase [Ilumatobacter sp.]
MNAALVVAVGVPGIALAQADDPAAGLDVLHIGGGIANSQDTKIVNHLESGGHTVTRADDDALPSVSEIEGYDLVWISSSVVPGTVGDAFTSLAVPVVSSEALLFDDLEIATSAGQAKDQNGVRLTADASSVTTSSTRRSYAWGVAVPSASVIATLRSNTARATVFTLEAGATLADGSSAAECRGGFFMDHATPSVLTAAGFALLDDMVDAMAECGIPNNAPTIDPIADRTDREGDTVSVPVSASDIDGDPLVISASELPDGISFDTTTNTITGSLTGASDGQYSVTVAARDARGALAVTMFTWTVDDDPALEPPETNDVVVFISGQITNTNDRPLIDRLTDRGFDVTVYDDNALPPDEVIEDAGIVWISSTVAPWRIKTRYNDLRVPVGLHEARLFDDLELATSSGERSGQHSIRDADGNAIRVSTSTRKVSWGLVGDAADVLATQLQNTTRAAVFTYDRGDPLVDGSSALQCRAGFFAGPTMPPKLTDAGFQIFDDVVDFLHDCAEPLEPNTAPVLDLLGPRTDIARDVIDLQISATDAEGHDLTFEATGLPPGLTIDSATGAVDGALPYSSALNSPYTVDVTVTDQRGTQDTATFTWTIDPYVTQPTRTDRPNVLVVMTDDQTVEQMRWLPSLRSYMEQGTEFTNSITNYPLCGPSRATFLTGLHASNHGLRCNPSLDVAFTENHAEDSLAPWLQASGVHTIHVGKYLNGYGVTDERRAIPAGWDDWRALDGTTAYKYTRFRIFNNGVREQHGFNGDVAYSTDVITDHLDEALRSAPTDDPFFAVFTPLAPHYEGGQRYAVPAPRHENTVSEIFRPPNFNHCWTDARECAVRGGDFNDQDPLTAAEIAQIDNGYQTAAESLAAVDESFDRILATLTELDRLDDTVIIFTSDNGFVFGEHGLDFGKRVPFMESLAVPLYITGPGFDGGSTVEAPVSNIDLTPTIVDVLGAPTPQPFDGQSLLDPLSPDRALLIEAKKQDGTQGYYGVYADGWLYVDWEEIGRNDLYAPDDPYQLATLDNDPEWDAVEAELGAVTEQLKVCSGAACRIDWTRPAQP